MWLQAGRRAAPAAVALLVAACSDGGSPTATTAPSTAGRSPTTAPSTTLPSPTDGPATTTTAPSASGRRRPEGVALFVVELQPEDPAPGGQVVFLRNGGGAPADVGCWAVASSATGEVLRLARRTTIQVGAALRLVPEGTPFRSVDTVRLLDDGGDVVDTTPELDDTAGDDRVWFRADDGAWKLGRPVLPPQVTDGGPPAEGEC